MKKLSFAAAILGAALLMIGCGEKTATKEEDAKLKADFAKKEFNLNDVPEKDRARVEAMMKANGQSKK